MNKLVRAIRSLHKQRVQKLLATDPKWINWKEKDGKNALHYLSGMKASNQDERRATLTIFKLLLKNGMDINAVHSIDEDNCVFPATPLWYAYTRGRNKDLYVWLLKAGATGNCLFAIAWNDDVDAAKLFAKHTDSFDTPELLGAPFLAAFLWKKFKIAEWLLGRGADVNQRDATGSTALWYAVKCRFADDAVTLLLRNGADPDVKNADGVSPRMLATKNRQRKMLAFFETIY